MAGAVPDEAVTKTHQALRPSGERIASSREASEDHPVRTVVITCALVLTACAQEITVSGTDGSTAGDASSGADRQPIEDAGTERDSGTAGDAASSPDAGLEDAAERDAAGLTWSEMLLPENTRGLDAVWGRSRDEVYAGSGTGVLYRWDGVQWQSIYQDPGNLAIHDLWGTDDWIYLATDNNVRRRDAAGNVESALLASARSINGIWGYSDDEVYVVAGELTRTRLLRFQNGMLTPVYEPTGVTQLYSVWGPASGELYFGGTQGAIFHLGSATVEREQIEWPNGWTPNDIAMMEFHWIGEHRGEIFAAGSRHLVFRRDADQVWRPVYQPSRAQDRDLRSGFSSGDLLHVAGGGATYGPLVRYTEGAWSPLMLTDQWELRDLWAAAPDRWFAVGFRRNGIAGVIVLGR